MCSFSNQNVAIVRWKNVLVVLYWCYIGKIAFLISEILCEHRINVLDVIQQNQNWFQRHHDLAKGHNFKTTYRATLKRFCLASFVCYKFVQVSLDHIPNMACFLRIETKSWVCKKLNLLHKLKNTPIFPHILFQPGKLVILTVNFKPRLTLPCKQKLCPLKSSLLSFYHFLDKAEFPCRFQNSVDLKMYQVYYLRVQHNGSYWK